MEHVVLGISGLFLFVAFCTIHGVAANLSPEDIQEERERERSCVSQAYMWSSVRKFTVQHCSAP